MKLKTFITGLITLALVLAFLYSIYKFCDRDMANMIATAFVTVATNTIGFYIGYQNNKKENK